MMNRNFGLFDKHEEINDTHKRLVIAVIGIGIILRLIFWGIHPPNWRLHAIFTPLNTSVFEYIKDFQGYKPGRLPFFDVLSAFVYFLLHPLLGAKALSAFAVVSSVASLPLFYGATRRLFNRDVALYSLVLFAVHPQTLVLASEGYPEIASTAFAVASIYAVTRGAETDRVRWYLYGGIAGTVSYLLFLPGVAFAIVTNMYIYLSNSDTTYLRGLLPGWPSTLYAVVPGVVGVAYLQFGPASEFLNRAYTNEEVANYIFTTEAYSTAERTVRYVAYTYVDFWWHFPGFDHERHILQLFDGIEAVIGSLFPLYLGGWIVITATLTAGILVGTIVAVRRQTLTTEYVLTWLLVYAAIWNAKNLNWSGGFNTRHVYPFFPAACILFGLGVVWIGRRVDIGSLTKFTVPNRLQPITRIETRTLFLAVFAILFAVLVVNATGQGVIDTQRHQITHQDPVQQLTNVAEKGDTVAVTNRRLYDYMLIYTAGDYRPVILTENDERKRAIEIRTSIADVRVGDPNAIKSSDIDYLLVNNFACRNIKSEEQALIDSAVSTGGKIAYDKTITRKQFRCSEYRTVIVQLNGD
jgi:cytochrome b